MNARQKAKKYKKKINTLESDNDLMRRIIADVPAMQELYDLYNKPKFVTHTTMQFQEFRARKKLPYYMYDMDVVIEQAKQDITKDLLEQIKNSINFSCEGGMPPTITASIFIGRKE